MRHHPVGVARAAILFAEPNLGVEESLERAGYEIVDGSDLPLLEAKIVVFAHYEASRDRRVLRKLRAQLSDAVIICVLDPGDTSLDDVLAVGADVVLETGDLELIPGAVEAALKGYVVHPQPSRRRLDETDRPLSSRERQTLALVTLGLSNGEIARKLHITESTVKSHLASSFAKLGVHSRAEATTRILTESDVAAGILAMPGSREQLSILRRDGNA